MAEFTKGQEREKNDGLSVGRYAAYRNCVWGAVRKNAGGDGCASGVSKGGGEPVCCHDRGNGTVDGNDGDCQGRRPDGCDGKKRSRPLVRFLFPDVPEGHPALEWISANFLANFLGLGWAATPAGLKAMEALEELEEERRNREDRIRGENRETDRYGNRSKENRMKQKNSRREKRGEGGAKRGQPATRCVRF